MKRYSKGFTLVELCVVLSVFALLLMLSISSFKIFVEVNYLSSFKRQIVSDLREAKHLAQKSGNYVSCHFYPENGGILARYTISTIKPDGEAILFKQVELPSLLNFTSEKEIRFASSSFCMPGYLGSIYLSAKSGKTKRIVVSSTGRVR